MPRIHDKIKNSEKGEREKEMFLCFLLSGKRSKMLCCQKIVPVLAGFALDII